MSAKTANVTARIQPEIKEKAEAILSSLGIPVSVFIDMTYRQVIEKQGVPYDLILTQKISARDEMSDSEFDALMENGLSETDNAEFMEANDVFDGLRKRVNNAR